MSFNFLFSIKCKRFRIFKLQRKKEKKNNEKTTKKQTQFILNKIIKQQEKQQRCIAVAEKKKENCDLENTNDRKTGLHRDKNCCRPFLSADNKTQNA